MRSFAIATALALAATLAHAAPSSAPLQARQERLAVITFVGAGPNPPTYTLEEPADGSTFTIGMFSLLILPLRKLFERGISADPLTMNNPTDNPLSVSTIEIGAGGYGTGFLNLAGCTFYGADGSVTEVGDSSSTDVGPPQPQVSGTCVSFS